MRKPKTNRTLYYSLVLSYFIILLIPLIVTALLYFQAARTLKKESQVSQYNALSSLQSNLEIEYKIINDFASKIASEESVSAFLNAENLEQFTKDFSSASQISRLSSIMQLYFPANRLIADSWIFSTQHSLVWHNSGVFDSEFGPNSSESQTAKAIMTQLEEDQPASISILNSRKKTDPTYIAIPLPSSFLKKGYLVIRLDEKQLGNLVASSANSYQSAFYLTDSQQHLLYQSAFAPSVSDDVLIHASQSPYYEKTLRSWIYRIDSALWPISCIAIVPSNPVSSDLFYLKLVLWISLISCLLGAAILIRYFSKRHYSPVQKMVETVRERSNSFYQENANEYQIVSSALKDLYDRHATIEEIVQRQNKTIYSYYLSSMMKGKIQICSLEDSMIKHLQEELFLDHYVILLVMNEFAPDFLTEHPDLIESAYSVFSESEFISALSNALGPKYHVTGSPVYDFTACIIGFDPEDSANDDNASWQSDLSEALIPITEQFQSYHCKNYYAVSPLSHGIASISEAYQKAFEQMSYAVMNTTNEDLLFYDDLQVDELHLPTLYDDAEKKIINYVQTSQVRELQEHISFSLQDMISRGFSFHTVKGYACGIMCTMIKGILSAPGFADADYERTLSHMLSLLVREQLYEPLLSRLMEAAASVCDYNQAKLTSPFPKSDLISRIEKVLEDELYNENLNIMFLADQLGMNPKYLSSLWQEQTGTALIDTIHKRRIDRFKQLITETNLSIKEAAQKVGYNSMVTFNRWFKKYEGITPGQAKELYKK